MCFDDILAFQESESTTFENFQEWNRRADLNEFCFGDLETLGAFCTYCYLIFCCLAYSSLTISAKLGMLGTVERSYLPSWSENESFSCF